MTKPTIDKLRLELKENKDKVQELSNMINSIQIRNIQIQAIISDRMADMSEEEKQEVFNAGLESKVQT
jgi:ribosomal protein S17E